MKSEKGSARRSFAIALVLTILMGYGGWVVYAENMDPCNVYPKKSLYFAPAASATFTIIPGVLGKQVYICSVEVAQFGGTTGATPGVRLSYGVQVAGTPCATSSPYAGLAGAGTLGQYGGGGTTFVGGNSTIAGPVPAAAASPGIDVCIDGTLFLSTTITYVQVP